MAKKITVTSDEDSLIVNGKSVDAYMTVREVARQFGVTPVQVVRWDQRGLFGDEPGNVIRTPGGHRRIKASVVTELLRKGAS